MAESKTSDELRDGVDGKTGDALDLQLNGGPIFLSVGADLEGAELVICDGSGEEQRALAAADAGGSFKLQPGELPNPVELWWRTPGWAERLAGPCDPIALRDALAKGESSQTAELMGELAQPDEDAKEDEDDAPAAESPDEDEDKETREYFEEFGRPDDDDEYQARLEEEGDDGVDADS